jgi:hypothetical protein
VKPIFKINKLELFEVAVDNQESDVYRQNLINRWLSTGLLDGLGGHVRENIAALYESQASWLIREQVREENKNNLKINKIIKKHNLNGYSN